MDFEITNRNSKPSFEVFSFTNGVLKTINVLQVMQEEMLVEKKQSDTRLGARCENQLFSINNRVLPDDIAWLQNLQSILISKLIMNLEFDSSLKQEKHHCTLFALPNDLRALFEKLLGHVVLDVVIEILVQVVSHGLFVEVVNVLEEANFVEFPFVSVFHKAVVSQAHQDFWETVAKIIESFFS